MSGSASQYLPFFEGSLDDVRRFEQQCRDAGLDVARVEPPGGCGKG